MRLKQPAIEPKYNGNDHSTVDISISEAIETLKKYGYEYETSSMKVDSYLKFSLPCAPFFVALMAIAIALISYKKRIYIEVFLCFLSIFFWYVLYSYSKELGDVGAIPPLISAWLANFVFGVIGLIIIIYYKKYKFTPTSVTIP